MASKQQMNGMLGVYLTAAELTSRGFIVSPTSRSAIGADLLVTDQHCQRAWSVQVKTNKTAAKFWLLNENAEKFRSASHIYVFVTLRGAARPDYLVVPSEVVAANVCRENASTGSVWYSFSKDSISLATEGWEVFGNPNGAPELDLRTSTQPDVPAPDFSPVEIRGEPLSLTILRERR